MEAGKRVYQFQTDDIGQVATASIEHFRAATLGQDRTIDLIVGSPLPPIMADRGALEDALLNLLTNAHKYSPLDRPIAVRVFADRSAVHVAVEDRGIGIARNEHHRVFEKFYRSDDRLSRSVEGSGLGLAIVQHVVQAHHGKITLRSAPGRGSTFTVTLPLAIEQPEPRRSDGPRSAAPAREEV
jgi:two-component system phosphate regulon sensor histidine kinase PhoR